MFIDSFLNRNNPSSYCGFFFTNYISTYILNMQNNMVVVIGMTNRLDWLGGKSESAGGKN